MTVRRYKVDYHIEVIQLGLLVTGSTFIHLPNEIVCSSELECTDVQRSGRVRGGGDG